MRFFEKKALVLGGSQGIGSAICLEFAKEGADVAFTYHSSEGQAELIGQQIRALGRAALPMWADVSNKKEVEQLAATVERAFHGLDILVCCAGIMPEGAIDVMQEDDWHRVIETNLSSAFYAIQACCPLLKNSRAGRIILISSQAAFTGSINHAHYAATKSGLLGLAYSAAKELGPFNITVNVVSPGRISTRMLDYADDKKRTRWLADTPLGRLGTPEEIAKPVVFLASEDSSFITGANLNVTGGMLMG